MNITNKKVIGAIVLLTVVLGSSAYLYYSDIQRIWETCRTENPDLMYCVYSVQRDSGKISQVEVLTANTTTEDPNDFIRWKLDKDALTFYNGQFIGAKAQWYVDYYQTYGEDKWINLKKKSTKIELSIEEFDTYVILRKKTEYYATASLSGTGGWLTEEFKVGQDWHKYTVEWQPISTRINAKHRLKWKLSEFGLGQETPRVLKNELVLNFDRLVYVNWLDAKQDFNFATLTSTNLVVNFNEKSGVIFIDPSIGTGFAKNDWFSLKSNTDQCLGNCEAIFQICNPTSTLIYTSSKEDFDFKFVKKAGSTDLKYYYFEVENIVDVNVPIVKEEQICNDINGTGISCRNEEQIIGYRIEKKSYWNKKDYNDIYIEPGSCQNVKIIATRKPKLGDNGIDWIATVGGYKITEAAWWNSDWTKKRQIQFPLQTITQGTTIVMSWYQNEFSAAQADLNDLRIVDESTNTELNRDCHGTWGKTKPTTNDGNCFFTLPRIINSGEAQIYAYYDNIANVTAPTFYGVDANAIGFETGETLNAAQNAGVISSVDKKFGTYSYLIENLAYGNGLKITDILTDAQSGDYNYSVWAMTGKHAFDTYVQWFSLKDAGDVLVCGTGFRSYTTYTRFRNATGTVFSGNIDLNEWYNLQWHYTNGASTCYLTIYKSNREVFWIMTENSGNTNDIAAVHAFADATGAYTTFWDNYYYGAPTKATGLGAIETESAAPTGDASSPTVRIFSPSSSGWFKGRIPLDLNVWDNNATSAGWFDANDTCVKPALYLEYDDFSDNRDLNNWKGINPAKVAYDTVNGWLYSTTSEYMAKKMYFRSNDFNINFRSKTDNTGLGFGIFKQDWSNSNETEDGYNLLVDNTNNYYRLRTYNNGAIVYGNAIVYTIASNTWYDFNVIRRPDGFFVFYVNDVNVGVFPWVDLNYVQSYYFKYIDSGIGVGNTYTDYLRVKVKDLNFYDINASGQDLNYYFQSLDCDNRAFDVNLTAYVKDYNTQNGIASYSTVFKVDNVLPVSSSNDSNSVWQKTDVNVQITCTDVHSRCKNLHYTHDGYQDQNKWDSVAGRNIGIMFKGDGNHTLTYWASDNVDNNGTILSAWIEIDATGPTVNIIKPNDLNQNYKSNFVSFDLNDTTSGVDILSTTVDINGVSSPSFVLDSACSKFGLNWHCEYTETYFDTNSRDYNITVITDDNAGNYARHSHTFKYVLSPSVLWGNVNDYYLNDTSGIDLYPDDLIDYNVTPLGQNDTNGIFNITNDSSGVGDVNVLIDLNQALPNDSLLVACKQNRRIAVDANVCWDINASKQALVITNLVSDANQMLWWFFDLNIIGRLGYELVIDYQYEVRFS